MKSEREIRKAGDFTPTDEYIVEGYATTFNDPYVIATIEGNDYSEQVDARAFDEADVTDVIFQYDHAGKVFARQKNGTLELSTDEHGLKVRADLSKSAAARDMYDEIKAGLVSEMSFAFTVAEDKYNKQTRTRTITKINKVYDVSAVSIPANPNTSINARSYFNGVIEEEKAERLRAEEKEKQVRRVRVLLELGKGKKDEND